MESLNGKVALVTGGGSGIGKAAALLLAQYGVKVAVLNRHVADAEEVQAEIVRKGGEAMALKADISNPAEMEKAVQDLVKRYGRLDIVIANAGVNGVLNAIESMEVEDWKATMDINLTGTFLTLKHTIPHLKKQGGSVVITSSVNGNRIFSNFGFSAYSTTKAGQVAFMKMAALELAAYGIRVNAICPGAIETNIQKNTDRKSEVDEIEIPVEFPEGDKPLEKKPGSPAQVAQLLAFLASDLSNHITGTEIYIDGAESLIRG
ncbi:SDR family oxidoreductase [Paenibacillus psychroresistens]|uniref:SDR family oxidoreductase n=1 Tax=Paenibacillus psychroresistens TaxID=1778678 RepID=A0A6B8RGU7_9BACL|nr:SDR family NAD(P)-dependent oxidoreductase [Paenibacillus psychroresistens]QGQ94762.1 SDR family oxidoreductase [Paenibacillus psychroresistens]